MIASSEPGFFSGFADPRNRWATALLRPITTIVRTIALNNECGSIENNVMAVDGLGKSTYSAGHPDDLEVGESQYPGRRI